MFKKTHPAATLLILLLTAVSASAQLRYKKNKFIKSKQVQIKGTTIHATIKIYYPVLKSGAPVAMVRTINQIIQARVLAPFSDKKKIRRAGSTKILFNRFYRAFIKYTREAEHPVSWKMTRSFSLKQAASRIITLSENSHVLTAGVRLNSRTLFYTFLPGRGRLSLGKIVKKDRLNELHALGERYFRRVRNINPGIKFEKLGLWIKKFRLNENFQFTKKGLLFRFNSSEIAPYAFGPTTFTIPYPVFNPYLKRRFQGKQGR